MGVWLLIICVVFAALAPLLAILPTRRQRQVAELRQVAALAGLQVRLCAPPGHSKEQGLAACYGLPLDGRRKLRVGGGYLREAHGWRNLDRHGEALPERLLEDFPEGVSHLVLSPEQAAVFWNERGAKEDIQCIKKTLEGILAACSAAE